MLVQLTRESLTVLLAICIGLLSFRRMNNFSTSLFFQLVGWLFTYVLSYTVTIYQERHQLPKNNHWVFNLNIFVETSLLALAAYHYFESMNYKKIIVITYMIYSMVFIYLLSSKGIYTFSIPAYITESIIIITFYSIILLNSFRNFTPQDRRPEIWMSTGILLYFACNLPYFSLYNFLTQNYPDLTAALFLITEILANLRYLFLAIGFWIIWKHPNLTITKVK